MHTSRSGADCTRRAGAKRRRRRMAPCGRRERRLLRSGVVEGLDQLLIDSDVESLRLDIDRCLHVLVGCFRWKSEFLTEQVEQTIAANEANEVVAATLGPWQRQGWGSDLRRHLR